MSCSTNLEESPLSDSKMDISDATNSLESAGVSPVVEHPQNNQNSNCNNDSDIKTQQAHKIPSLIASMLLRDDDSLGGDKVVGVDHANVCILNENEAMLEKGSIDHVTEVELAFTQLRSALDNRFVEINCRPEVLPLPEKQVSSLTLANSHPLMSPTATDSDSENSCLVQGEVNHKFHNFPDVVPNRERQLIETPVVQLQANVGVVNQRVVTSSLVSTKNNLNCNKAKLPQTNGRNKISMLRTHSPDLLSSGSEAEVSQYHAAVESNFQSVALIPNSNNVCTTNTQRRQRKQSNADIAVEDVTATTVAAVAAGSDDISSLDSISNHSFDDDEDIEHNLASLSPSSSLIDGLDDDDDDDDEDCEGPEVEDDFAEGDTTPTNMKHTHSLPQYSAEEERRDSRNWQKITLPDGKTREIDMKVIEPYKRVLSHGGYLKAGGHNAIVIFCACHLPDRSRADYNYVMDNLFLYVVKTLEQLVTEDYVLIYLHGGTSRRNVPSFPWMKKCYQLLDRRLRKSLKNMYLVHPTFWIKSIVWMARPFVSTKFWRKLIYVKSLEELNTHVAVEKAAIPDKVKQYDAKYN